MGFTCTAVLEVMSIIIKLKAIFILINVIVNSFDVWSHLLHYKEGPYVALKYEKNIYIEIFMYSDA